MIFECSKIVFFPFLHMKNTLKMYWMRFFLQVASLNIIPQKSPISQKFLTPCILKKIKINEGSKIFWNMTVRKQVVRVPKNWPKKKPRFFLQWSREFFDLTIWHKSRYHSIPGTTSSYCSFLKPNEPHFYQRRYFCFSCHNCENFKTDPFTRKYSCTREDKAGAWKKQVFKGKKKK